MKSGRSTRLYIVGAAGSGKTTLAKRISLKTGIECYHLDDIFYKNENGVQRSETERNALFSSIINKAEWIIEDNGSRACFAEAMNSSDKIILLYPHKFIRAKRIIKRYLKQKLGLEETNYKPSIPLTIRMFKGSNSFETGRDGLKERISQFEQKALILKNNSDINKYISSISE